MQKHTIDKMNETIYYEKAPNGLEIYVWQNKNVHNTFAALNVNYGSYYYRYQKGKSIIKDKTGIAHFLEHVMFNMDDNTNASDLFHELGTFDNAYTSSKNTCYYIKYQDNEIENLKVLINLVLKPYFTDKLVNKEKGIIIEEKRRSMNNPYNKLFDAVNDSLFVNYNSRETTLGSIDDINAITADDLKRVYDEFYNPANMQLVICGQCEPESLIKEILKLLKPFPKKTYDKKTIYYPEEPSYVNKKRNVIEGNVVTPKVRFLYKIPRNIYKDIPAWVLGYILSIIKKCNFGPTTDFREKLFINNFVNSFDASFYLTDDFIILNFYIESNDYHKVIEKIKYKMKHLKVTKDDFIAKTHSHLANAITVFENNEAVNDNLISHLVDYGKIKYDLVNDYLKINLSDVKKVIEKLDLLNTSLVILNPQKKQ